MTDVYVLGVGMTPSGKFLQRSVKDLTQEAVEKAVADAGIGKADISAAFFANATQSPMEGQHMIAGQVALNAAGLSRIPIVNVENACASGSSAFHLAYAYVKAGLSDVALAVGAEKMHSDDRKKTFAVFNGAWDVHRVEEITGNLKKLGEGIVPPPDRIEAGGERSVFMDVYAALAKQHMKAFGSTERQLAAVSA